MSWLKYTIGTVNEVSVNICTEINEVNHSDVVSTNYMRYVIKTNKNYYAPQSVSDRDTMWLPVDENVMVTWSFLIVSFLARIWNHLSQLDSHSKSTSWSYICKNIQRKLWSAYDYEFKIFMNTYHIALPSIILRQKTNHSTKYFLCQCITRSVAHLRQKEIVRWSRARTVMKTGISSQLGKIEVLVDSTTPCCLVG